MLFDQSNQFLSDVPAENIPLHQENYQSQSKNKQRILNGYIEQSGVSNRINYAFTVKLLINIVIYALILMVKQITYINNTIYSITIYSNVFYVIYYSNTLLII